MVSRDSHKSVFDAIKLSGSKAIILPCDYDNKFGIKLGANYSQLSTILNEHSHEVFKWILLQNNIFKCSTLDRWVCNNAT